MADRETLSVGELTVNKLKLGQAGYETPVFGYIDFTEGTEADNVVNVTAQLVDREGKKIFERVVVDAWLSSLSTGLDVSTAPNGGTAIATYGTIVNSFTANVNFRIATDATTGKFTLALTDTGTATFYLVVRHPSTGELFVSTALTTAA